MAPPYSYTDHLTSHGDLVTTYEATRAGFVSIALEKNHRATPFIAQAKALKLEASTARTPADLKNIVSIRPALVAAAGVSDKALNHLEEEDKSAAIAGLIRDFLEPAGPSFVEELVYRFLLTKGDSLGGEMRNIAGALAQRKVTRALLSALDIRGAKYRWQANRSSPWIDRSNDDTDIELRLTGLSWQSNDRDRLLLFNIIVPPIRNNVDLCLLACSPKAISTPPLYKKLLQTHASYLALGELKGGIDPAGADEHWKTARTALDRARTAYSPTGFTPMTFFVAAAIEHRMAQEIWTQLETGVLHNAANLTDDNQVASIARWLCSL